MKRFFDIILSIFGLVVLAPALPLVALLIKLDSKGPVIYRCERVGKGRKPFAMYKFRTMIETTCPVGHSVSPRGDVRVTRIGRLLRRTKVNELPQLVNILKGEMSFVGPRPEAPDLAALYPQEATVVFTVKPGLVGPSQAKFRNEEELYPEGVDPQRFYIDAILPQKLETDMAYVGKPSLSNYLYYILIAVKETLLGVLSQRHFFENKAQLWLFGIDVVFVLASYYYAVQLRFSGALTSAEVDLFLKVLPILLTARVVCFIGFGLYGVLIRYLNLYNYLNVMKAVTVSTLLTAVAAYLLGFSGFPRTVLVIDWFILNFMMIFIRIPGKIMRSAFIGKTDTSRPGVFIYGACEKGIEASTRIKERKTVLGFLDDDPQHKHKKLREFPVLGNKYDIEPLSKIYPVHEVVIAAQDLDKGTLNQIFRFCHQADLECMIYSDAKDTLHGQEEKEFLFRQKIKDWIEVVEEDINRGHVHNTFENRSAMLVGVSPRLVNALTGHLSAARLSHLYVAEKYEHHLNEIMARNGKYAPERPAMPVSFGYDPDRLLDSRIRSNGLPDVIVYMGTRKFPYLLNVRPIEAVEDNIIRPWRLYQNYAAGNDCIFVFGSAVGAANPGHIIQKSLALAETCLAAATSGGGRVCIVRMPSLIDNTGAIVEQIRRQVRDGQPVTINHPEEARYFTTVAEAAKFILHAVSMLNSKKESHQIYQYKTTRRVEVNDLVRKIRHEYGQNDGSPADISSINRNNAAIWQEEIDPNDDRYIPTEYKNILIARREARAVIDREEIAANIADYQALVQAGDEKGLYDRVAGDYEKYVRNQR